MRPATAQVLRCFIQENELKKTIWWGILVSMVEKEGKDKKRANRIFRQYKHKIILSK
jgi:hypothetical protein